VHTGQHYDHLLSDVFFADLHIPAPDVHLGVGSGSHGVQTGAMLAALDAVLEEHDPDCVVAYGDTNSTLAGAVAAVKLHLPLAHVEAGLRSFNRRMPEEHNRVLTDHAADLCLAPTEVAMENLRREGLGHRSTCIGDVMADVCLRVREAMEGQPVLLPDGLAAQDPYVVATLHRAENTDRPERLETIMGALAAVQLPVVLMAHPRLVARAAEFGVELGRGAVRVTQPLPYPQMVNAVLHCVGVVTDSGGLQKEAFLLGAPCTTLRTETEWPETLVGGWNFLDPDLLSLEEAAVRPRPVVPRGAPYGDGHAAEAAVRALDEWSHRS
jgi:UDP-N-acetylglucosamine 2-epimerase (non-hydrolysing)